MRKYSLILIFSLLIAGSGYQAQAQTVTSCNCECLKPLFDYLIASDRLFTTSTQKVLLSSLIADANAAGYPVSPSGCSILTNNTNKYFYAMTTATSGTQYKAMFGDCSVVLKSTGSDVTFSRLASSRCEPNGYVSFNYGNVHKKLPVTRSINVNYIAGASDIFPNVTDYPAYVTDTAAYIRTAWSLKAGRGIYKIATNFAIDGATQIPDGALVLSADLYLFAYIPGFNAPAYTNAHTLLSDKQQPTALVYRKAAAWNYLTDPESLMGGADITDGKAVAPTGNFQTFHANLKDWFTTSRRVLDNGIALANPKSIASPVPDTSLLYATYFSERYQDSTRRPFLDITWSLPSDTATKAQLYIDSCFTCKDVEATNCVSLITDTIVNPYLYGLAGNWRPFRSMVYYSTRSENDFSKKADLRNDGTIRNFFNFWQLVDNKWQPQDTAVTRWVWNTESTLFNEKGAEMENKDPLGRYNAGIYGYGNTLATAITQNAKYRETGFDGFEDYNFPYGDCLSCKPARSFDFSSYKGNFDTTEQHTGKYSLRVGSKQSAGLTAAIIQDVDTFNINITTDTDVCAPRAGSLLKGINVGANAILPPFSPLPGKKVLVSVWVKESGQCNNGTYTGSQVSVVMSRSGDNDLVVIAKAQGNIIEGWQRYELVVDVPATAGRFTINLQNNGNDNVYFDDLRVHPYNANMKSYVYDEVSLRLMAELDENNYATFYEYDDDGSLVRVKKETERGIMTIKESRNGFMKD